MALHQSARLRDADITLNGRFPSTTPARTLLDLATRYTHVALLRALADSDDDRDLWLRRHGYLTRRYGKRQIDERPTTSSLTSSTPSRTRTRTR